MTFEWSLQTHVFTCISTVHCSLATMQLVVQLKILLVIDITFPYFHWLVDLRESDVTTSFSRSATEK